jgi:hypothetical protein
MAITTTPRPVTTEQLEVTPVAPPKTWWTSLMWVLGAAALGFVISAVFASVFRAPRNVFVLFYALAVFTYVSAYVRWAQMDVAARMRQHWGWGLLAALVAGAFVVSNVLNQPASAAPTGLELVWSLIWLGVVYGSADALLLSIVPLAATWQAFTALGWTHGWPGRLATGAIAMVACVLVAAIYHLGFPEYRNAGLVAPIIGNSVMSLASLLSMSPLAALLSHIAMHISAVLHGVETTVQLPPHYG